MEIIPNVHLIPGIVANPYLIIEPTGLTLIDTGLPGSHKKILKYMAELGYAPKGLRRIIITHSDYDHVGSLAALRAATGARIFSSAVEAEAIATGKASRPLKPTNLFAKLVFGTLGKLFKASPAHVDEFLTEGEVLPVLGGLESSGNIRAHTRTHFALLGIQGHPVLRGFDRVREDRSARLERVQ